MPYAWLLKVIAKSSYHKGNVGACTSYKLIKATDNFLIALLIRGFFPVLCGLKGSISLYRYKDRFTILLLVLCYKVPDKVRLVEGD